MKPNVFILGAPKCATTSLCAYLETHPKIFVPQIKEPFFFSYEDTFSQDRWGIGNNLSKYLQLYKDFGKNGETIAIDGSTSYLRSPSAVDNILEFNPKAKFIIMLRNPVDVAVAFHMQCVASTEETEPSFSKAWRAYHDRKKRPYVVNKRRRSDLYHEVAALGTQLSRVLKLINSQNILVLFQEDMAQDTKATYQSVIGFLQIPDDGRENFPRLNSSHQNTSPRITRLLNQPPTFIKPIIVYLRRKFLPNYKLIVRLKRKLLRRNVVREKLSDEFRKELVQHFYPEIQKLETLLSKDLSHWYRTLIKTNIE